jgi:general secretion pathway protein C
VARQIDLSRFANWQGALRVLPTVAAVVLAALIGHGLAQTTWALVGVPVGPSVGPLEVDARERGPAQLPRYGQQIATLHLFGEVKREVRKTQKRVAPPPRKLNLSLVGVLATGTDTGMAIIRDEQRNERVYRVADPLPDGGVLREVHANYVVVEWQGHFEELELPHDSLLPKPRRTRDAPQPAQKTSQPAPEPPARASDTTQPEGVSLSRSSGPGQWLAAQRSRWLDNPQTLGTVVRVSPAMERGQLVGYRVSPRRDHGLLSAIGLRPTDIVTAVNEIPLTDLSQAKEAVELISKASQVQLSILRAGQPETIQVSFRE